MSVFALILAAGSGERMGLGMNKVLAPLGGVPVLVRSVRAFDGQVDGRVIVARPTELETVRALLPGETVVPGGDTRQRSVLAGLMALPEDAEVVLVHDGARPFVSPRIIARCIESVYEWGSGVASVPVTDTIKRVDGQGAAIETPMRASLRAAQTPQGFKAVTLRAAIEALEARGETATDDAAAMEAVGHIVFLTEGDEKNIKLTTQEDLRMAESWLEAKKTLRMGHGYDVHRLTEGRSLILCGVTVPYEKGLLGHSDADVALHALMDALLGAAALGDIGRHFPDSDPQYKGISSVTLLERVVAALQARNLSVCNVDVTIVAQRPKLAPYIEEMVKRTAHALGVPPESVNVKATTTEGLGFAGEGLGIEAHAVATVW